MSLVGKNTVSMVFSVPIYATLSFLGSLSARVHQAAALPLHTLSRVPPTWMRRKRLKNIKLQYSIESTQSTFFLSSLHHFFGWDRFHIKPNPLPHQYIIHSVEVAFKSLRCPPQLPRYFRGVHVGTFSAFPVEIPFLDFDSRRFIFNSKGSPFHPKK